MFSLFDLPDGGCSPIPDNPLIEIAGIGAAFVARQKRIDKRRKENEERSSLNSLSDAFMYDVMGSESFNKYYK